MTQRDYVKFANAIKEELDKTEAWMEESLEFEFGNGQLAGIERMARSIADICRADNERFDSDQFLKAAGIK